MLEIERVQAITAGIFRAATADSVRIWIEGGTRAFTRFANNEIHQTGEAVDLRIAITCAFGSRHATVKLNGADPAMIEAKVRLCEDLARMLPEDPEYEGDLGQQKIKKIDAWFDDTARMTPADRVEGAIQIVNKAKEFKLSAGGLIENRNEFTAVAHRAGLFGYHRRTELELNTTLRTADGQGSGWAQDISTQRGDINFALLGSAAAEKARASAGAKELPPGAYTVVLEPAAASTFLTGLSYALDARANMEGRGPFSAGKGKTRQGEKLFSGKLTVRTAPDSPLLLGRPFAPSGMPQTRTDWVKEGVLSTLFVSRSWAKKSGAAATCEPRDLIMSGGESTLDEMIAGVDKGLLVTRFWYTNLVDPRTVTMTGLTRDGLFAIEGGKVVHPVKNMRFNESMLRVFKDMDALSEPVRMPGWDDMRAVPAIRVKDFRFTSTSDAV
ncbi:MAG: hypothetical protein GMKNLPBB_01341 [Myxococcota bacterium]|nr:hypothetical protein [Myxococcota bacterium]